MPPSKRQLEVEKIPVAPSADQLLYVANSLERSDPKFKDKLFYAYAKQAVMGVFFDRLVEFVDEDDIDKMQGVLADCTEEEILSVISLPEELSERIFSDFEKRILEGENAEDVMKSYVEKVAKYKFSVGFHTSPEEVRHHSDTGAWTIKGRQKDHRDDDLPMAYYSKQYHHLYKKKGVKYIYVVRASPEDKTDDNWYRNSSLSVITKLSFHEATQYIEQLARQKDGPADETPTGT